MKANAIKVVHLGEKGLKLCLMLALCMAGITTLREKKIELILNNT